MKNRHRIVFLLAALPLLLRGTDARNRPVRVFASNGIKAVMKALQPQCERMLNRLGIPV